MPHYIELLPFTYPNSGIRKIDEKKDTNIITKYVLDSKYPITAKGGRKNKDWTIHCWVNNEADAQYLEGLGDYDYVRVKIDSPKYPDCFVMVKSVNTDRISDRLYEVSIDCTPLINYSATIKSKKGYIENAFVDSASIKPTIIVPTGSKVLYNGVSPKREGLVDIYECDSIELVEPIPTSMIKVYDDMNSTDEVQWKLISRPEEHKFVGNWIIEYGNIRWRSDSKAYIWNGTQWVENGMISVRYSFDGVLCYLNNINQKDSKFNIIGNKMKINAKLYRNSNYPIYYKNLEFIFENGYIRCNESDVLDVVYYNGYPCLSNLIINVNSDYVVKTQGYETDNALNSGSNGWVMTYWKNTNIPVICYSGGANLEFSGSNGDPMVNNF